MTERTPSPSDGAPLRDTSGAGRVYVLPSDLPGALQPHRKRLEHAARFMRAQPRAELDLDVHHWVGRALWLQPVRLRLDHDTVTVHPGEPEPRASAADAAFLASALDHTHDVVLVTESQPLDAPGPRVVYANAAFTRLTGYALEDIVGRTPRVLQGPRTERGVIEKMARALRSWTPVRTEITNYHRDGTSFLLELDIRPVADETGWYTHWIAIQRDVTERRAREAETLQAERAHTMSLLAGGVAHDFNNLLVGLMGNLELARHALHDPKELAELIDEAEAAAQQARALTRQLMHFSHDPQPLVSRVDLGSLLPEAVAFALRGTAVDSTVDVDDDAVGVLADAGQLRQIMSNLIINAVEAMEGRGRVAVRAFAVPPSSAPAPLDPSGRWVAVEVEDSGPGIPTSDLARVFDPYMSTKRRGSGLGLTVCWTLVAQLGGHIEADSSDGRGAKFRLFLPVGDATPPPAPDRARGDGRADRVAGLRVAWMDDDDMVRAVATRMGRRLGWDLDLFSDGAALLDRYASPSGAYTWPDLFVLDLTVRGGLGGIETLRRLRALRPGCPVILASGYSAEVGDLAPEELTRTHRVVKPFRVDDLVQAALTVWNGDASRSPVEP